jgi:signal peptidase I
VQRWDPLAPVAPDDLPPIGPRPRGSSAARTLAEIPLLAAVAIVITLVLRAFLAQAFFIPSSSMEPQLAVGDRVVVSRLSYRLHEPRRGDVVVFTTPGAPPDERTLPRRLLDDVLETVALKEPPDTELIKRVLGLPGERIEARAGVVYVDGRPVSEPYLGEGTVTADFGPVAVPEGHVFVLGDNRANSQDSRFPAIGPVPVENIVGRSIGRIWPPGRVAFM